MGQDKTLSQDFVVEDNSHDDDKQDRKQKLVRNEFKTVGKYDMPLIKKQDIDLDKIDLWGYSKIKLNDTENSNKTLHFFTYDWKFESVYEKPEIAMEKLDQHYALLTPDFSLYWDMPKALQIYSTFKSRWCGAYWQKQGKIVIPTIEWGDENSFEFYFDGIEQGSIVAVSMILLHSDNERLSINNFMFFHILQTFVEIRNRYGNNKYAGVGT